MGVLGSGPPKATSMRAVDALVVANGFSPPTVMDVRNFTVMQVFGFSNNAATGAGDTTFFFNVLDVNGIALPMGLSAVRSSNALSNGVSIKYNEYNIAGILRLQITAQNANATIPLTIKLDCFMQ